jgi:hypothetical protein
VKFNVFLESSKPVEAATFTAAFGCTAVGSSILPVQASFPSKLPNLDYARKSLDLDEV